VWCACPPLSFLGVVWQTQQITHLPIDSASVRPTHAVGTETGSERGMCCELHGSLSLWRDHGIDDRVRCGHARLAIFGCVCPWWWLHQSPTHNAVTSIVTNSTTNPKRSKDMRPHTPPRQPSLAVEQREQQRKARSAACPWPSHLNLAYCWLVVVAPSLWSQLSQTQHSFSDSALKRPIPASKIGALSLPTVVLPSWPWSHRALPTGASLERSTCINELHS
jgi:hypothetical protein